MLAIKEIEKIIEITNAIIKKKIDPFSIDIKELIEKVKKIFPKLKTTEEFIKDAEAIQGISGAISEQTNELNYRLSFLNISPKSLLNKLEKLNNIDFLNIISLCFYPILSTNFINFEVLKKSYEYWISIKREKIKEKKNFKLNYLKSDEIITLEKEISLKIKKLEENLNKICPLKLENFLKNLSQREKAENLFILSFLISAGKFNIEINEEGEYIINKGLGKKTTSIIFQVKI